MILSKAKLKDLNGLNLNLKYVTGKGKDIPTLHLPQEVKEKDLIPSDLLCQYLEVLEDVWCFNKEATCRTKIDAILANAIYAHRNKLHAFGEVDNSWKGSEVEYSGTVDYMIGSGLYEDSTASDIDSFILAVDAKLDWPIDALAQVLAEAGCLLRNRLAVGKKTPVFAILTNSKFFKFFAIDIDGTVYSSGPEIVLQGEYRGNQAKH